MKNYKNIIIKSLCTIIATTLLMCGSFYYNNKINIVYGDTITRDYPLVNELRGNDGLLYKQPQWLRDLRNISEDVFNEAYNIWYATIDQGTTNQEMLIPLINLKNYVNSDVYNGFKLITAATETGVMTQDSTNYFKKLLGCTSIVSVLGIATALYSLENFCNKVNEKFKSILNGAKDWINKDLIWDSENGLQFSDNIQSKNYYTDDNNNNYNTGDTYNTPIYNNNTKKFYDITNNTYNDIDNYSFDLSNNSYIYNGISDTYYVQNFNNYTEINKIVNGVSNIYKMYYSLPNGDNSYNLTEDTLHGLKTNFNISTYTNISDNNELLALYHFNGNLNNSAYGNNSPISFYNNGITDTYTYINEIWDTGIYLPLDKTIFSYLPNEYTQSSISFRYYANLNTYSNLYLKYKSTNGTIKKVNLINSYTTKTTDYIEKTGQTKLTLDGQDKQYQIIDVVGTSNVNARNNCHAVAGIEVGIPYAIGNEFHCACKIESNIDNIQYSNNYTQWFIENNYDIFEEKQPCNVWTEYNIKYNSNNNTIVIYNGNTLNTINDLNNAYPVTLQVDQDGYSILDELAFFNNNKSYYNNKLPFDTNNTYVLPNNIDDVDNLILVKADQINNYQIGGKRSSSPTRYDVFLSVDENNLISSIQQYNGSDWISIDGAIYNPYYEKWVNVIGYSILTGEFESSDLPSDFISDDSQSWLSKQFNTLQNIITDGFNKIESKINELIGIDESINNKINDYVDNVRDIDEDISEFTDQDLETDDLVTLASSVNGIYDSIHDNGLDYLIIVPLIVTIIRLVI